MSEADTVVIERDGLKPVTVSLPVYTKHSHNGALGYQSVAWHRVDADGRVTEIKRSTFNKLAHPRNDLPCYEIGWLRYPIDRLYNHLLPGLPDSYTRSDREEFEAARAAALQFLEAA